MLYTVGVILAVGVEAAGMGALEVVIMTCQQGRPMWSTLCSADARKSLQVVSLALLTGVSVWWVLFLTRVLAIKEQTVLSRAGSRADRVEVDGRGQKRQLPFGQVLISGCVESVEVSRHLVTIRDVQLRFWGGYALRNGWVRAGDCLTIVYQCSFGLNYVMVFEKNRDARIRMVGVAIHATFLILSIAGASLLPSHTQDQFNWLALACATLFVVSFTYLFLLVRARRALQDLINDAE